MADLKKQTELNAHMNDALQSFVSEWDVDLETVLNALEDVKSDAPTILERAAK